MKQQHYLSIMKRDTQYIVSESEGGGGYETLLGWRLHVLRSLHKEVLSMNCSVSNEWTFSDILATL